MDSIPLVCKICPDQPRFSDVSHLLTHIASKGHLFQSKNAQLRSHHDPAIGQQLEAYNEWYNSYHIEALLAQRIAQKDSKVAKGTTKQQRDAPARPVKREDLQQKPKRPPVRPRKPAEPPAEDPIDPQLSLFVEPGDGSRWSRRTSHGQEPHPSDLTPHRQAQFALRRSQTPTRSISSIHGSSGNTGEHQPAIKSDWDEDGDRSWLYAPSPPRTTYPDPTTLAASYTITPTPTHSPRPSPSKVSTPSRDSQNGLSPQAKDALGIHFLKLKGAQYPGMALFDSASPNSQRLRNQKKEHSLLAQMERAAARIEPMEQIYFPQWTLKKERVITGNVESSPIQEFTPKPKRRRRKSGKAVLGELSVNVPGKNKIPRDAKTSSPEKPLKTENEDPFVSPAVAKKVLANTQSTHICPAKTNVEAREWRLNTGMPEFTTRQKLAIFKDADSSRPSPIPPMASIGSVRTGTTLTGPRHAQSPAQGYPKTVIRLKRPSSGMSIAQPQSRHPHAERQAKPVYKPDSLVPRHAGPGKEKVEPMLDTAGRVVIEDYQPLTERITQRYFSVSGNDPPLFYQALPPQMEFGGLTDHSLQSSSLNPLNPGNWQMQNMSYIPQRQPSTSMTSQFGSYGLKPRMQASGPILDIQGCAPHPAGFKRSRAKN